MKMNINITLDSEVLEKMEGIKNKSQFVNEILTDYFFKNEKKDEKTEILAKIDELKAEIIRMSQKNEKKGIFRFFR